MRANLNERSSEELLEVMNLLGYTSTNHTLNIIITEKLKQLKSNTHKSEVILNDHSSTSTTNQ